MKKSYIFVKIKIMKTERPGDDSTLDGDVGYQPPKKKVP